LAVVKGLLAGVVAAATLGYAAMQPGDPAPLPYPSYQADDPAPGDPPKTPGMTDREWCLKTAKYWEGRGAVVPDGWQCQGKPMGNWRGQP
jgi:hypothetical protein